MKKTNKIAKIPNKLLGFYIYFFKPFKWFIIFISLFSGIIVPITDSFILPVIIKNLIEDATENNIYRENIFEFILNGLIMFAVIIFLSFFLKITSQFMAKKVYPLIIASINIKLLKHIHNHSYRYFSDNFGGSLANKISDLSNYFLDVYSSIIYNFTPAILILVINTIFFTMINSILGGVLIVFIILDFIYLYLRSPLLNQAAKRHSEEISIVRGKIVDSLTNFNLVKLNSKQYLENKNITLAHKREIWLNKKSWTESQKIWMPLGALSRIFEILIIVLMFYFYSKSKISIAEISYILMALTNITRSIWIFNNNLLSFVQNISKMQQALDTLLVPVEIEDKRGAKNLQVKEGNIELKNVCFHYGNEKNVLDGFNLHIKPGEKVGIVGPSGAGKTTLVNLLLRMFDVQKGEILIDGQNVVDVKQKSLREKISVVTQDSTLFHRTLKENIVYTKEKATEKEIISASKKAGAHEFIKDLPKKYDTLVGERGIKLSGGQRQRVNIARTILKDAPILVLDEATSALDSETEAYIQTTFEKIMQGKTTIAIAHRLSTLKLMDRIIVINYGKIIEEGSHRSLIAKKGVYSKLWSLQSSNFIENEDL